MKKEVKEKEAKARSIPITKFHYFHELDYLRGFAILAVITIHAVTYYDQIKTLSNMKIFYMFLMVLASYGVASFFLVSGFALYNKYNTKFNLKEFYIKRFLSIIPAYVIFSFLYEKVNRGNITALFITDLLTGGANQHLWFIIVIIEFYIAYPIIIYSYNLFKNHCATKYYLVLVIFTAIIYNTYMQVYWFIPKMLGLLFYFVLGMYIRDNYESTDIQIITRKYWLLITAVVSIGTVYFVINLVNATASTPIIPDLMNISIIVYLLNILYITALIVIFLYISTVFYKNRKANFISLVGSYSFGIYLIHAFFVWNLARNSYKLNIVLDDVIFYPYVLLVSLIISMAAVFLIKQLPYHEYIIGKTSSEKSLDT
jgi:peptidoglycan/LPS O-acetylase OafA/YrhL